jgi:hypothetical protein
MVIGQRLAIALSVLGRGTTASSAQIVEEGRHGEGGGSSADCELRVQGAREGEQRRIATDG